MVVSHVKFFRQTPIEHTVAVHQIKNSIKCMQNMSEAIHDTVLSSNKKKEHKNHTGCLTHLPNFFFCLSNKNNK